MFISAFLLNPTGTRTVTHWSNKMFVKPHTRKTNKNGKETVSAAAKRYTYRSCKIYDTVIRSSRVRREMEKNPITIRITTLFENI